jgi:choline-sulfatase
MELAAAHDHVPDETVPLGAAQTHADQFARTFDGTPVATAADQRRAIAKYWGMCSLVDTHVGRILATLAELGLEDDTLVFFSTDHGEMMGAHGMWGKGVMYEASVRVPLLLRLPGQRRSSRVRGPVSQIDVVPTLLDYLGVNGPALPGQSLRPAIETGRTTRDVFMEWNPAQPTGESARTIRTADGWKLTLSSQGRPELRNLTDDPWETGPNRLADPLAGTLADRLRDWQQRTADKLELPFTTKSAALASAAKGKRQ